MYVCKCMYEVIRNLKFVPSVWNINHGKEIIAS